MSTVARAVALPANLVERLCLALESSEPACAIRELLSCALLPEATERVLEQALLVGRRARQRQLPVTGSEVRLSLGVVLVLCGALLERGAAS